MRNTFLALAMTAASLVFASCATTGGPAKSPKIDIIEHGIYDSTVKRVDASATAPGGAVNISASQELIEATDTVRVAKGTTFGLRYIGADFASPELEIVRTLIHPEFYDPFLKTASTKYSTKLKLKEGATRYWGYRLEEDFELVPGDWIFEFSYQGKLLASQKFTLIP